MPPREVAAEAERKLRADYDELGLVPAAWLVDEVRSGEWRKRQRRNSQAIRRNRARLAQLKRDGYTFDSERRLVAPALAKIHKPERRENGTRPRERRSRRTVRTAASRDDPSEPEPPLVEIPPTEFRRRLDAALRGRA
jgi:hypothetical protein